MKWVAVLLSAGLSLFLLGLTPLIVGGAECEGACETYRAIVRMAGYLSLGPLAVCVSQAVRRPRRDRR